MSTQSWIYLVSPKPEESELKRLGEAGWELCAVDAGTFYFKRPALSFRDRVTLDQKRRYFGNWGLAAEDSGAEQ